MTEKAFAAVLTEPRKFDYREYPIPDIGPEEGLLRVEAAGLCGTDYEQFAGHLDGTKWDTRPIIPGHEIMGHVDRLGREAAREWGVKEGDRVTVDSSIPCGRCFQCNAGRAVLCKSGLGYGIRKGCAEPPYLWGGYATHMYLHPRARLHPIPDDIPTNVMSLFNPLSNAVRWMLEKPNMKVGDKVPPPRPRGRRTPSASWGSSRGVESLGFSVILGALPCSSSEVTLKGKDDLLGQVRNQLGAGGLLVFPQGHSVFRNVADLAFYDYIPRAPVPEPDVLPP